MYCWKEDILQLKQQCLHVGKSGDIKRSNSNCRKKHSFTKKYLATALSLPVSLVVGSAGGVVPKKVPESIPKKISTTLVSSITSPVVGIAASPGGGYWEATSTGSVFNFGSAQNYGSMAGKPLNKPIVGIAATPNGGGYWLVASDGGIFSFGGAKFYGSMGGKPLNKPVVGMSVDPATGGYWLVASDGGIFSFNAPFKGSTGAMKLNKPIIGMSVDSTAGGYWLVASDGGIFSFGDAKFYGSTGNQVLSSPITGMTPMASGSGYFEVSSSGQIFSEPNSAPVAASIATQQIGKPYVYGSPSSYTDPSPSSFDCSGFSQWVWYHASGVVLPRMAINQASTTTAISANQLQPGDLVFYDTQGSLSINHVAIYIGGGDVVEANNPQVGVVKEPITWDGMPVQYGAV